jgi:hypothetical protein
MGRAGGLAGRWSNKLTPLQNAEFNWSAEQCSALRQPVGSAEVAVYDHIMTMIGRPIEYSNDEKFPTGSGAIILIQASLARIDAVAWRK